MCFEESRCFGEGREKVVGCNCKGIYLTLAQNPPKSNKLLCRERSSDAGGKGVSGEEMQPQGEEKNPLDNSPNSVVVSKKTIRGKLFWWNETGMEGGFWGFQDERFIARGPAGNEAWSYDGSYFLGDKDYLKIFAPDGSVYWEGELHFVPEKGKEIFWAHCDATGLNRKFWFEPFLREYKGELTSERIR